LLQDEPRLPSGGQASHPEYRHLLALCCREKSRAFGPDDRAAAAKALAEATEILASLVRDFPQTPDYRYDLSETYAMVDAPIGPRQGPPGSSGSFEGRDPSMTAEALSAAEERLRKALAISEGLVAEYPGVPDYLVSQAHIHHRLGEVFRRMRRLDEAEQSDRRAVTVQASLVANFPELISQKAWLAAFRNSLADTLLVRDKLSEARALSEETISTTSALSRVSRDPEMWYLHALLADSNRTLSAVLRRSGQPDLADKALREAEMHRQALRENPPPDRPPRKGPPGGE
jgi:tetratricopeptide (TPR) repeat protein